MDSKVHSYYKYKHHKFCIVLVTRTIVYKWAAIYT